jgi:methylamine---corrinoid protein Co-methyltransferase
MASGRKGAEEMSQIRRRVLPAAVASTACHRTPSRRPLVLAPYLALIFALLVAVVGSPAAGRLYRWAPNGTPIHMMLSYAQEPGLAAIDNATLETVYGRTIKAGSPWEALAGWREAELSREVIGRAGRHGLCVACVENASKALGEVSATSWGGFRPTDLHHIAAVSEFKTNYDALSKLVHTTRICGEIVGFAAAIYGGYFGGPEGTALGLAAAGIVLNQNYLPSIIALSSVHPFLGCTTNPEILWAYALMSQALSRNTHLLYTSLVRPAGRPGTKTLLYEIAAFALATTVSGHPILEAAMTATGTHPGHCSGLEPRFCADVARGAAGLSREQANDLVLRLLAICEPQLKERPVGKPFQQVYDLTTIRPTPEWQGLYDEVSAELIAMGLPPRRD